MGEGWGGRNNFERMRASSKLWGKDISKLTTLLFLSFPVKTDFDSFIISTNMSPYKCQMVAPELTWISHSP